MSDRIVIYTDGSSRGNPGPGGYGVLLLFGKHRKELSQGYRLTTNNRMELLGVIIALESITNKDFPVIVYTDSKYIVNAVQLGWLKTWLRTNFKGGKKNADLWRRFNVVAQQLKLEFIWVKGHADSPYNNRCDELATTAADSKNLLIDEGYENLDVNDSLF
jgi:ribonuclease HI